MIYYNYVIKQRGGDRVNMEQRFSELEITELEEVFSKSFKSKNPIMQFIVKWEKQ